jgi:hypothetical protein
MPLKTEPASFVGTTLITKVRSDLRLALHFSEPSLVFRMNCGAWYTPKTTRITEVTKCYPSSYFSE